VLAVCADVSPDEEVPPREAGSSGQVGDVSGEQFLEGCGAVLGIAVAVEAELDGGGGWRAAASAGLARLWI